MCLPVPVSCARGALGPRFLHRLDCFLVQANKHKPVLRSFDRFGNRVDMVEYHPAYHRIMQLAAEAEIPSLAWTHRDKPGAMVVRGALGILHYQVRASA